ncbi:hypothetical protein IMCC12053_346 [Celeribacter marinus]|uniref:Uncharacterized protein n=1 Tax=Celeribacter marinus TaxID=1397108 RepID=A0A0N9ZWF7_9RHOB|nr:hypothetical protein IMCC12053_346 [Celeribacter marinus]
MVNHAREFTPHTHVGVAQQPVRFGVRAPVGSLGHTHVIGGSTQPCVSLNQVDENQPTDARA